MITDFHNHVTPAVDDGAQDAAQTEDALKRFAAEGVGAVIATPHFNASLTAHPGEFQQRLDELDEGWLNLQAVGARACPQIRLARGAEVMLDTPNARFDDPRIRLAGTRFVLVEFPYMTVPPRSSEVLRSMRTAGWVPVLAHPERYNGFTENAALEWRHAGALLQVNEGSLVGGYGPDAKKNAFALLSRGAVDYLCSDYHARGRPRVGEARETLLALEAAELAHMLMDANPGRLLQDEMPLPVAPLEMRSSLWKKISGLLRSR